MMGEDSSFDDALAEMQDRIDQIRLPGVLPDWQIAELAATGMIAPFLAEQERFGGVTRGLGPCSYDVTLGNQFVRMLRDDDDADGIERDGFGVFWKRHTGEHALYPGEFVLATTVEVLNLPNNIVARVADKSTWARRGLQIKNTLVDPGFRGRVTLELSNEGCRTLELAPNMGIAQIVFERLAAPARKPYSGRYMGQTGVVIPKGAV